jgi:hypothetical protein
MRVMVIVKGNEAWLAGELPSEAALSAMGKFNEELQKAGVLLDLSGLKPPSAGARVKLEGGKRIVVDGPFAEAKELIAGYWVWQVKTKQEAIEWAKRIPFDRDTEVEIRPFFELADFQPGPAVDRARELGDKLAGGKR